MSEEENRSLLKDHLAVEESMLVMEIQDLFEEDGVSDLYPSNEIYEKALSQALSLRANYRHKHGELQKHFGEDYEGKYGKLFTLQYKSISEYIKAIKQKKKELQVEEEKAIRFCNESSTLFLINESDRLINDLKEKFRIPEEESDKAIKRRYDELICQEKIIQKIGEKIEKICTNTPETSPMIRDVRKLMDRYDNLKFLKREYIQKVEHEVNSREIEKVESFNTSSLNIKLIKFKDYSSPLDIYTFQTMFEKLYLKSTPKRLLPDLLRNNYLENPALMLVKNVDDIEEIWKRLIAAYGDCKTMLAKKLHEVSNMDLLWKLRDPEKVTNGIAKIITVMKDLLSLCKKHGLENNLFYGDALERIYKLLGDSRVTRWLATECEEDGENLWNKLIDFLEKDMRIYQQKILLLGKERKPPQVKESNYFNNNDFDDKVISNLSCFICGERNHVATNGPSGSMLIQYFACKKFVDMSPADRFTVLRRNGLCFQCLFPGAKQKQGKHREGKCQRDFTCKHQSHDKYPSKMHVLVCEEHKDTPENRDLLQHYKQRCILRQRFELPDFSKNIQLTFHSTAHGNKVQSDAVDESAIYMLQTIKVNDEPFTIFYDSGCGDFVSRFDAVKRLRENATKEVNGPIKIGGVGGVMTESPFGIYSVKLPLINGNDAIMTGVCLQQITPEFPDFPLQGKVETDISNGYRKNRGNVNYLPKLPSSVGGHVDFMIGIKYLRYFPEKVFQLPSGLTIYKSCFKNSDGSTGVIGGPHQVFTEIERYHHLSKTSNFVAMQYPLFKNGYQVNPDISIIGYKNHSYQFDLDYDEKEVKNDKEVMICNRQLKSFEKVEHAGTEITYRCVQCRDCKVCKMHDRDDTISIREEVEQEMIEKSVTLDKINNSTVARLPMTHNPIVKLCPNKFKALKVFNQQMKKLANTQKDKDDVIKSEMKLHTLGHVEYVTNLPRSIQKSLEEAQIQNYIPWRTVWKVNSVTTPCRMVFDASQPTDTGFSLNDILAKGRNNMNKLVEIFIRWRIYKYGFHTDIQKMYNSVKLHQDDWCFQRYLWKENLDDSKPLQQKIIKTLIYGVRSSGNQAETGLKKTAMLSKEEFPEIKEIVFRDIYVDDCLSGEHTKEKSLERADQLELVLNRGGFKLKGVTFSGSDPHNSLSDDGITICVAGLLWHPKDDLISLDIKVINFARKHRGRKTVQITSIPSTLTRRHCASKVAEVFDLTGMLTPIIAGMKLDLHDLVVKRLNWDDAIPDNLRQLWISHFEMISEMKNLKFDRAIIPEDALSLDVETLAFGDASKCLICIAIYVRFKRKCGGYSCQLVLSKSRLVPEGLSLPRAELYASLVNTHSSEVVRKAFYQYYKSSVKFTDSQIVLFWICNNNRSLKQWVRNRVIDIQRFTTIEDWRYIQSENMIADLGTRRGVSLKDVDKDSRWCNGYDWMRYEISQFPCKSIKDITLTNSQQEEIRKESPFDFDGLSYVQRKIPDEVFKRRAFSNYIIDPNKYRFKTVIRILAIVIKFVFNVRKSIISHRQSSLQSIKKQPITTKSTLLLLDDDIRKAEKYFFRKAALEIQHFLPRKQYEKFTKEKDGILYYTGRILPTEEITIVGKMTEAMKDLSASTFCVPVVDRYSPLAYCIINEVHWYNSTVRHSGVESVWRFVLKKAFIIEGRSIVKWIRESCQRCRYLQRKNIEVAMGPISRYNVTIAPCFYISQVDLCGPFRAYSHHHKRATIKIWLVVFCCNTTSCTAIKTMEDYSSTAFIQAFVRFSCENGYPKLLLSDEGSQIVKAFHSMELNYVDIKHNLHKDVSVEYELCPVGGHNINGRVERKIREVKKSLEISLTNRRLSIMQWETISAEIANNINNLPLALGNIVSSFESMDLLTPNRLRLGRNNERSPVGSMIVTNDPDRVFKANQEVFNAWFENWLLSHVPKLMAQPKWYKSDKSIQKGDIVLFLKQDTPLCSNYQYGIVEAVVMDKDEKIRKVEIRYRNHNEKVNRITRRAVRSLVVIHHVDELDIMDELSMFQQ